MTPIVTGNPTNRWLRYAKPAVRLNRMARMSNNSIGKEVRVGENSIPGTIVGQACENIHLWALTGFQRFHQKTIACEPTTVHPLVGRTSKHPCHAHPRPG